MEYKRINFGSHTGEYLVEVNGVKRIMSYAEILELEAKEKAEAEKVVNSEVVQEIDKITFPYNDIESIVGNVEEAPVIEEEIPKKKKSRRKK